MKPRDNAQQLVLHFINAPDEAMREGSGAAWIDTRLAKQCAAKCCQLVINTIDDAVVVEGGKLEFWIETLKHINETI